jgi:hypothetical protein
MELTSLADGPNQYLLGAWVLKLEISCCTRALPHLRHFGGRFFRRSCSLIGTLTSKYLPHALHSNLVDSHVFPPPTSTHDRPSTSVTPTLRMPMGSARACGEPLWHPGSGHWRESREPASAIAERIGAGAMEPDIAIPRGSLVRLGRARWCLRKQMRRRLSSGAALRPLTPDHGAHMFHARMSRYRHE